MDEDLHTVPAEETIVVMVSIGNRAKLSDYTFPPLSKWATKNGYSSILMKKSENKLNRFPHFNKLQIHKLITGFSRYIIVDDDIIINPNAPKIPDIPQGYVGLAKDAVQTNTEATHVSWTANTGFMVVDREGLYLLQEAYELGDYPYTLGDCSGKGIWGPFDQGVVNDLLFRKNKIYQLDSRWNCQVILEFFINGKGWEKWKGSKTYRLGYYASLLSPFPNKNKSVIRNAYAIHLIRGNYPSFFSKALKYINGSWW